MRKEPCPIQLKCSASEEEVICQYQCLHVVASSAKPKHSKIFALQQKDGKTLHKIAVWQQDTIPKKFRRSIVWNKKNGTIILYIFALFMHERKARKNPRDTSNLTPQSSLFQFSFSLLCRTLLVFINYLISEHKQHT